MKVGPVVLKYQLQFQRGLRTAYWRDSMRHRILGTAPVSAGDDRACEIHVMTSSRDWLDLVWALKTFYRYSRRSYPLAIHDDGTLTEQIVLTLRSHFPRARVILRPDADAAVLPTLAGHPRCLKFRSTNHLSPKVFDFAHYLQSDRMLLLDSDVLFFHEPTELLRRIEDPSYRLNTVNGDTRTAYTVDPKTTGESMRISVIERFNSGLGLIHRESLRPDWLEEILGLPGINGNFWLIEQTCYALCSSRFGCELLPASYDVHLGRGTRGAQSRHYVGQVRHLMYIEGINKLVRQGFLA